MKILKAKETRIPNLSETLDNFDVFTSDIQIIIAQNHIDLVDIQGLTNKMNEDISKLYINSEILKERLKDIKKTLLESIETEYDKIISIIDHYHHIHDDI